MTPQGWLAVLDATWTAPERVRLGEWTLRRGHGGGSRVCSVGPTGDPGLPLGEAVARAAAICRAWGQRPIFQIGPDDDRIDDHLDDLGWEVYDQSVVYAGAAQHLAASFAAAAPMTVAVRGPLAALDELWAEGGVGPARRAVMRATPAPKETLLLRLDDRPAAALFVAAVGDTAMLHALYVGQAFRRRGLGRAAVAAAARRAAEMGATTLGLAVTAANQPARALYGAMGMTEVCTYHYRRAPEPPCVGR
ncbi:MAG: GNAT family N-acetyltransferase [Rubrimonas sp.]